MRAFLPALVAFAPMLSCCGLTVPEVQEAYRDRSDEKFDEATLIGQIKCEIRQGVAETLVALRSGGRYGGESVGWLRDWGAKVTLKITVDEKSGLNPGISLTRPYQNAVSYFLNNGNVVSGQSFTAAIGLQASSDATRIETIGFTYAISELLDEPPPDGGACTHVGRVLIDSDLKIRDFILNKAYVAHVPEIVDGKPGAGPFSVFSDQITFVVTYGGNATPTWKLVNVTASATSPLVSVMRTRTHDLTFTLAPIAQGRGSKKHPQLSPDGEAVNLAQLIGQATASAISSRQQLGEYDDG